MSNKIKAILGILAIAIAIGAVVILIVNSQNQEQSANTINNISNGTNTINATDNTINNEIANNVVNDKKVDERDYSEKTMEDWKEAVKNFYNNNSSIMPDKIEVIDDKKNEQIIIDTLDSEGIQLDRFVVDKRTWLATGFEGNTIDFIAGKFIEIELHPKVDFKDDEEVAIVVFKTEEEKKKLIEKYFEDEIEFSKYVSYNLGNGPKLLIIPRYDTVFISLNEDTIDEQNQVVNSKSVIEEVRGKTILANIDLTGKNLKYSLEVSHLINSTGIILKVDETTGKLIKNSDNERIKYLSIEEEKTEK